MMFSATHRQDACATTGAKTSATIDMNTNPLKEGALSENSAGLGTVTRRMVQARAVELAFLDGLLASEATPSHFAQAKRELTGKTDMDPKEAVLDSAPESERWNPVPGSTGHKVPVCASEDEDDEGRSDNERLVDEGVAEAELDRENQASRSQDT
jgi:hypothetical protein